MIKLVTIWSRPPDGAGFEAYYRDVHTPLARQLPALSLETMRMAKGDIYRIALITFGGDAELRAAMRSPEGMALAADAKAMEATFAVISTSSVAIVD